MKGKVRLLMVLAALNPLWLQARGIADIIAALAGVQDYSATVTYSVTLPSRDEDVVYKIGLSSHVAPSDTLSPCDYLIGWTLDTPSGPSEGWTSYFDGNLYRYRDHRLKEYHTAWDAAPFVSKPRLPGVQLATQFAELLPAFMARELRSMSTDSLYTLSPLKDTTVDGRAATRLDAEMNVGGETVRQVTYFFDNATSMPLRVDIESNPASITEQTISVRYGDAPEGVTTPTDEESLMALYSDHFEKYRESNFRIENLRDTPVPTFTLPTADGGRSIHHRGEPFPNPVVIAMLDPDTSFSVDVVRDLRTALDSSAVPADVLWAVTTTNTDKATSLTGALREGETLLLNARSLARDCGVSALPVVLIVGSDGVVKNVLLGYNPDMVSLVLQSMALL